MNRLRVDFGFAAVRARTSVSNIVIRLVSILAFSPLTFPPRRSFADAAADARNSGIFQCFLIDRNIFKIAEYQSVSSNFSSRLPREL